MLPICCVQEFLIFVHQAARQHMTGRLTEDIAIIMDKLEDVCAEIQPHGKVSEFLENPEVAHFLFTKDTLCLKGVFYICLRNRIAF